MNDNAVMDGFFKVYVMWTVNNWPMETIYASDDFDLALNYGLCRARTDHSIMHVQIIDDNAMVWATFGMLWQIRPKPPEKTLFRKVCHA